MSGRTKASLLGEPAQVAVVLGALAEPARVGAARRTPVEPVLRVRRR
jgi:hypothetical protein